MKNRTLKTILLLAFASVGTALLIVLAAKALGFQGNGDGGDMSWWNMIHALF